MGSQRQPAADETPERPVVRSATRKPLPNSQPATCEGLHYGCRSVHAKIHWRRVQAGGQDQQRCQQLGRLGLHSPPPVTDGGVGKLQALRNRARALPSSFLLQGGADHRVRVEPTGEEEGWQDRLGAPAVRTPAPPNPDAVLGQALSANPAPVATPTRQQALTARACLRRNVILQSRSCITGRGKRAWPYDCHGVVVSPCQTLPAGSGLGGSPFCFSLPEIVPARTTRGHTLATWPHPHTDYPPTMPSSISIAETLPLIFIQTRR